MANSLLVVATKVGSMPDFLTHEQNAIFVLPRELKQLAVKNNLLIINSNLRQKIISNGFKLAMTNTTSVRSKEILDNIEKYVDE